MARMGKNLTPEEEARNKMLMRERDRERKRMKRMDPEYRKLEQERDRDRKKARRANEAFRQLEKMRDKMRKDRKKRMVAEEPNCQEYATLPAVSLEPEVIISDATNSQNTQPHNNVLTQNNNNNQNIETPTVSTHATTNSTTTSSQSSPPANVTSSGAVPPAVPPMGTPINKSVLYTPHTFTHHPLPLTGVALMPQLCHPILHQNISASLYPPNGIKQEYNENQRVANGANAEHEREYGVLEPDFVLPEGMSAPHPHFHNPHAHHLHPNPHSGMFQHMTTSQAHMPPPPPHMRLMPPHTHAPLPPPNNQQQQQQQAQQSTTQQQHVQQQQQQQQMTHYEHRKPV